VLAFGPDIAPQDLGQRSTFADVAASVAAHLRLPATAGSSFLAQ
jgi:phosphopentomutase